MLVDPMDSTHRSLITTWGVSIPLAELSLRFSRSGGPGGQHVNTAATRVELTWDVRGSPSLSETQRGRVLRRLASRIDSRGVLHLVCEESRSQAQNREYAIARLSALLERALEPVQVRRPTRPSTAAVRRRLEAKRRRSEIKRMRGERHLPD